MKLSTKRRRASAAIAMTLASMGALLAIPSGSAFAADPASSAQAHHLSCPTLATRQSSVEQDLSGRVSQLGNLSTAVNGSSALSAADKSTLQTDLANEQSGINALASKVPNDTTCSGVVLDRRAMVLNYRVYVVMTPQVLLVMSADNETAIALQLTALESQLEAAITAAQNAGKNTSTASGAYADLQSQLETANASSSGISATTLAFTPASYPGCFQTFKNERASLKAGDRALAAADHDVKSIDQALS